MKRLIAILFMVALVGCKSINNTHEIRYGNKDDELNIGAGLANMVNAKNNYVFIPRWGEI